MWNRRKKVEGEAFKRGKPLISRENHSDACGFNFITVGRGGGEVAFLKNLEASTSERSEGVSGKLARGRKHSQSLGAQARVQ